ncbi:MAG: hypothetical protein NWF06_01735 [Candidatus Bathyarchaeota archaeon]|nr:hypothetical protein [Candidatus Bathyarchaeum sp.]
MNWKRIVGLVLFACGITVLCVGAVSAFSIGTLTVEVVDEAGVGVEGAEVYFFEGGGAYKLPEEADDMRVTDVSGRAVFTSSGFYNIGVVAEGYTSDYAFGVYSFWGAAGINRDSTYTMDLFEDVSVSGGSDVVWVDSEPEVEIVSSGLPFEVLVGAVVSCVVGGGLLVYDKFVD